MRCWRKRLYGLMETSQVLCNHVKPRPLPDLLGCKGKKKKSLPVLAFYCYGLSMMPCVKVEKRLNLQRTELFLDTFSRALRVDNGEPLH